ncbi:uncharacterized protein LOC135387609 isoform X2 [Ornithodoros turicata]|uniref:uncharacterized protein LOC135387609 isoform X2 n=1 Tax=Ornithodoros turicata TaxID=34597 RepID=UPI0031390464
MFIARSLLLDAGACWSFYICLSSKMLADNQDCPRGSQTGQRPEKAHERHVIIYCAILSGIIAAVLAVAVSIKLLLRKHETSRQDTFLTCDTPAGLTYAHMVTRLLNRSADPCTDFNNFVCGNGGSLPAWKSVFQEHVEEFALRVGNALDSIGFPQSHQTPVQKAAGLYQSCKAGADGKVDELEDFKRILTQQGIVWPRRVIHGDALSTSLHLRGTLKVTTLLSIRQYTTIAFSSVTLYPSPTLAQYGSRRDIIIEAGMQETYFNDLLNLFKSPNDNETELQKYEVFASIENVIIQDLLPYIDGTELLLTNVEDLAKLTPEVSEKRWEKLLKAGSDNLPLLIVVKSRAFLQAFTNLFNSIGEDMVADFIGWMAINRLAPHVNLQLATLFKRTFGTAKQLLTRRCVAFTEMYIGWPTFLPVVSATFTARTLQDIHGIIDALDEALKGELSKNKWAIDNGTTLDVKEIHRTMKFVDMTEEELERSFAGFSDMGMSITANIINAARSEDVNSEFDTTYMRDRNYNLLEGATVRRIPPYMAMLPAYDENVTAAVKYSGLGMSLAGAVFGKFENKFSARAKDLIACYDTSPLITNEMLSFYVDLAGSLSVSWEAFQSAKGGQDHRLQGLAEYSEDEMFFIAFCHSQCSSARYNNVCNEETPSS